MLQVPQEATRGEATAKLCELIVMEELANLSLAAAAAAAAVSLTRAAEAAGDDGDGGAACMTGTVLNDAHPKSHSKTADPL